MPSFTVMFGPQVGSSLTAAQKLRGRFKLCDGGQHVIELKAVDCLVCSGEERDPLDNGTPAATQAYSQQALLRTQMPGYEPNHTVLLPVKPEVLPAAEPLVLLFSGSNVHLERGIGTPPVRVGGREINSRASLSHGEEIEIGGVRIRVHIGGSR